jgi:hypothetical protein
VNPCQPRADVGSCQPSKHKDFGFLNASAENRFASVDTVLRFGLGDQIAAVLNQDETLSRERTGIKMTSKISLSSVSAARPSRRTGGIGGAPARPAGPDAKLFPRMAYDRGIRDPGDCWNNYAA